MKASQHSFFADELNRMLEKSSFSSEVIVGELNRRGFPLPLRTFAYWLKGYFLPRFESAFQLVDALENICGVTDNRLTDALLHDLSLGASFVPDRLDDQFFVPTPPATMNDARSQRLKILDEKVDWSADLVRTAIKDDVYVNEDFTKFRHRVTVLAVVPDVENPSLTISSVYEPGERPIGDEHFYDIRGARLGKQGSYEEDGLAVHGVQLYLPDTVVPGELHEISYTWDYVVPAPVMTMGERIFPWILEFYSCTVTFTGAVPQDIEYVTFSSDEEKENPMPSGIPLVRDGNSVRIATRDFGLLTAHFRCSLP